VQLTLPPNADRWHVVCCGSGGGAGIGGFKAWVPPVLAARRFTNLRPGFRYNLLMWGRVILGAVIVVPVCAWLAAIWIMFTDPQELFRRWRWKFTDASIVLTH
jgi:hypothetical protein